MSLSTWSKSEVEYGRKVLDSGLEGARSGREAFLQGSSLAPFLKQSVRNALRPAAIGAFVGALSGCSDQRRRSAGRVVGFSLLGGVIGFLGGFLWENRRLAASIGSGALRSIGKVRDEHWFERHPIDYA